VLVGWLRTEVAAVAVPGPTTAITPRTNASATAGGTVRCMLRIPTPPQTVARLGYARYSHDSRASFGFVSTPLT
jgi:hypothetical protein